MIPLLVTMLHVLRNIASKVSLASSYSRDDRRTTALDATATAYLLNHDIEDCSSPFSGIVAA